MAWNSIAFNAPPLLTNLASDADAALSALNADVSSVRAAVLASPAIDAPASGTAHTGAITAPAGIYEQLVSEINQVVIHPWCEGLGQGVGHNRSLSARNAVNAAAKKLGDVLDSHRPTGSMDVLALLITGSSYADLQQHLEQFLTVYSDATVFMCARRCAQLAALESDKVLLPDAAINARFNTIKPAQTNHLVVQFGKVACASALAMASDIAGNSAETDLVLLCEKKQTVINQITTDANAALSSFTGGAGKCWFMPGTGANAASRALINSDVGYEYPLAVCVLITGAPGALDVLRSMLQ